MRPNPGTGILATFAHTKGDLDRAIVHRTSSSNL